MMKMVYLILLVFEMSRLVFNDGGIDSWINQKDAGSVTDHSPGQRPASANLIFSCEAFGVFEDFPSFSRRGLRGGLNRFCSFFILLYNKRFQSNHPRETVQKDTFLRAPLK